MWDRDTLRSDTWCFGGFSCFPFLCNEQQNDLRVSALLRVWRGIDHLAGLYHSSSHTASVFSTTHFSVRRCHLPHVPLPHHRWEPPADPGADGRECPFLARAPPVCEAPARGRCSQVRPLHSLSENRQVCGLEPQHQAGQAHPTFATCLLWSELVMLLFLGLMIGL